MYCILRHVCALPISARAILTNWWHQCDIQDWKKRNLLQKRNLLKSCERLLFWWVPASSIPARFACCCAASTGPEETFEASRAGRRLEEVGVGETSLVLVCVVSLKASFLEKTSGTPGQPNG